MARRRTTRRSFGKAEQLPSGKWRARYTYPPGTERYAHKAPHTFYRRTDAEAWLNAEERLIELGIWTPPADRKAEQVRASITVRELIDRWLTESTYKASTISSHRGKLSPRVLGPSRPGFDSLAAEPIAKVDRERIRRWWKEVQATWPTTGNSNSFAYKRLRTAFQFAVEHDLLTENPVQIKGAGIAPRPKSRDHDVLTIEQVLTIIDAMPARYRIAVSLMCWAGLRLGEVLELRSADLIGLNGTGAVIVRVRRNVQRVKDEATGKQVLVVLNSPKTPAGNRDIQLPEKVAAELRAHVEEYVKPDKDALIITTSTGRQMMDTHFRQPFATAKGRAGRPEVTPHDCRRFYGTWLVNSGVVALEEARRLMGHETVEQLMEYQRSMKGFEKRAADAMNELIPERRPISEQ
ncbi:site-specific integrase [Corynebacterium sp. YIM 101645]|uniref:Site-specific integrase n=1 Tax=Corynebacterium lemuris TaxID=1859292 RepID=A0ABT2FU44_9CORY|nr:site-specific integrase [Corynebacterium lemuris]MCS5478722.1 site-specific integrase [Corynebacterium lemuris]